MSNEEEFEKLLKAFNEDPSLDATAANAAATPATEPASAASEPAATETAAKVETENSQSINDATVIPTTPTHELQSEELSSTNDSLRQRAIDLVKSVMTANSGRQILELAESGKPEPHPTKAVQTAAPAATPAPAPTSAPAAAPAPKPAEDKPPLTVSLADAMNMVRNRTSASNSSKPSNPFAIAAAAKPSATNSAPAKPAGNAPVTKPTTAPATTTATTTTTTATAAANTSATKPSTPAPTKPTLSVSEPLRINPKPKATIVAVTSTAAASAAQNSSSTVTIGADAIASQIKTATEATNHWVTFATAEEMEAVLKMKAISTVTHLPVEKRSLDVLTASKAAKRQSVYIVSIPLKKKDVIGFRDIYKVIYELANKESKESASVWVFATLPPRADDVDKFKVYTFDKKSLPQADKQALAVAVEVLMKSLPSTATPATESKSETAAVPPKKAAEAAESKEESKKSTAAKKRKAPAEKKKRSKKSVRMPQKKKPASEAKPKAAKKGKAAKSAAADNTEEDEEEEEAAAAAEDEESEYEQEDTDDVVEEDQSEEDEEDEEDAKEKKKKKGKPSPAKKQKVEKKKETTAVASAKQKEPATSATSASASASATAAATAAASAPAPPAKASVSAPAVSTPAAPAEPAKPPVAVRPARGRGSRGGRGRGRGAGSAGRGGGAAAAAATAAAALDSSSSSGKRAGKPSVFNRTDNEYESGSRSHVVTIAEPNDLISELMVFIGNMALNAPLQYAVALRMPIDMNTIQSLVSSKEPASLEALALIVQVTLTLAPGFRPLVEDKNIQHRFGFYRALIGHVLERQREAKNATAMEVESDMSKRYLKVINNQHELVKEALAENAAQTAAAEALAAATTGNKA